MNIRAFIATLTAAFSLTALPPLNAALKFDTGVKPVPDGSGGLVDSRILTGLPSDPITHLRVELDVAGPDGFLGDLFVTLQRGSGYAVLLNRVGREPSAPDGYGDQGLKVTFELAGPDIHTYRETLGGPPPSGFLTGTWDADGRAVDPSNSVTSSPRSALLSSFLGLDPNGEWILFLADVNPGGQVFLRGWGLDFAPIPEPAGVGVALGAVLAGLVGARRWLGHRRRKTRC